MTKQRLVNSLGKYDKSLTKDSLILEANLGITLNGVATVQVPGRNQYVYARLRDNTNEMVQAFNDQVYPQYDLPVLLVWQKTRYVVQGRDTLRYGDWGNNFPYLPLHGWTHSLDDGGQGSDITFVYERQIIPGLISPYYVNGSGSPAVFMSRYIFRDSNGSYHLYGNTGTVSLTQYNPPTGGMGVMVLIGLDSITGNPFYAVGSGSYFSASLTGANSIVPFIPANPNPNRYIEGSAVRLINGTTIILWPNIYDVRQFINVRASGSAGGGGGIPEAPIDGNVYGRKNAGWTAVSGSSGISDAPSDGNIYGRENSSWVKITGSSGGGGGGVDQIGMYGESAGIPLGTGTILNVNGSRLTLSISGTTLALGNSPDPYDNIGMYGLAQGVPLGTGTWLDIGNNLTASLSGTVLRLDANTQGGGGGGGQLGIYAENAGTPLQTGTILNVDGNAIIASVSGTVIQLSGTSQIITAFLGGSGVYTYNIPPQAKTLSVIMIGGGGGGGGGFSGISGSYRSGGPGGGGGAYKQLEFNVVDLPSPLTVVIGWGGKGGLGGSGTAGISGWNGTPTYICSGTPSLIVGANLYAIAYAGAGGWGAISGTSAGGGGGGGAGFEWGGLSGTATAGGNGGGFGAGSPGVAPTSQGGGGGGATSGPGGVSCYGGGGGAGNVGTTLPTTLGGESIFGGGGGAMGGCIDTTNAVANGGYGGRSVAILARQLTDYTLVTGTPGGLTQAIPTSGQNGLAGNSVHGGWGGGGGGAGTTLNAGAAGGNGGLGGGGGGGGGGGTGLRFSARAGNGGKGGDGLAYIIANL